MAKFAISADSHIVEPGEVFTGLPERFGDDAPRMMDTDRLTAVIRRQRMDGLRDQLAPDDSEAQAPNYTDCVLDPICKETQ